MKNLISLFIIVLIIISCIQFGCKKDETTAPGGLATVSTKGLVAYYRFNGNANDESGNGNNGTVYGSTLTTNKFNQMNKAYNFNGNSNYIQIPNDSSLQPTSALTVSALIFPKGFYFGWCQGNSIIGKGGDGDIGFYGLGYDDNNRDGSKCNSFDPSKEKFQFTIHFADGTLVGVVSNTFVQLNTWYFVIGTYDGNSMNIYVNGILENTISVTKVLGSNNKDVYIGRFCYPSYPYWVNGVLDDIRIYNRSLTSDEIQALYQQIGS
jgi:hypothetical protein